MGLQSINRKLSELEGQIHLLKVAPIGNGRKDGKDGKDGRDGKDGKDGKFADEKELVNLRNRLNSLGIGGGNANRNIAINGNSSVLSRYTDINLIAGSNVTITYAFNDTTKYTDITIATAGGGSLSVLEITGGTVDDSNTVFTFASEPTLVNVNTAVYRNGVGVTITGTTVTLDNPVGTDGDIYGLG